MGNFWTKIWIWTKVTIYFLIFIYVLAFILCNRKNDATVWYSYERTVTFNTIVLSLLAFLAGVICTILVRTGRTTLRQLREAQARNRTEQLHRDMEQMKQKASLLHTKPPGDSAGKT